MNRALRRRLLDWHMYLGLLCAPYFALYGVSAIAFNHYLDGEPVVSHWERAIAAELAPQADAESDLATARAVRDALEIGGVVRASQVKRARDASLHFGVSRPGRVYRVAVSGDGRRARVEQTDRGWISVVRGLHGGVAVPGIGWTRAWGLYTDASVVALTFAVASGLWLFWPKRRQRAIGAAAILAGSLVWAGVWAWLW